MINSDVMAKSFNNGPQSLESVVRASGIELRNSGSGRLIGLCPFHNEKSPSFTVYPNERYHCFGCKESGDTIDFVRKHWGLSFYQAVDFIGFKKRDSWQQSRSDFLRERRERLKKSWRQSDLTWTIGTLIRCGHKALTALTPDNFDEHCIIIEELEKWKRWHDILVFGSSDDKRALLKELKEFQVFKRGRLWRADLDFCGWLKKHSGT